MTLSDKFREPEGFQWGHFQNHKGADIRFGRLKPEGEIRGTVVVLPGFRESIEKYHEVTRELSAQGLDVWLMDWRGQGGSERYLKANPQKAHHEGYDEQIETLHAFATQVVETQDGKPLIMLAHSMGAHTGLRYLKEHEGVFDSAMVTSPMLDIQTAGLPRPLARQMANFAKAGKTLDKYVPGGADWNEKKGFQDNNVTSDKARYELSRDVMRNNDALKIGDPTYGWLYHTFLSIDVLKDEDYLKSIKTPILMQMSDEDKIVVVAAQERAAKLLPHCTCVEIPGAKHEIWMERDDLRNAWVQKVAAFIESRIAPGAKPEAPSPKKHKPHAAPRPPGM